MSILDEKLTEQFYAWERRGRGWQVFPEPVCPEPPFRPFYGHYLPETPIFDDGRRPTVLSSFIERMFHKASTQLPQEVPPVLTEEEPQPQILIRNSLVELQTFLPANLNVRREDFSQFLSGLSLCREPIAFELVGTPPRITSQFVVHPEDESLVREQLNAYSHDAVFMPAKGTLEEAWHRDPDVPGVVVEFGLANEFMFPLECGKLDPFVGIIGALTALRTEDIALYQVILEPTRAPWSESVLRSVTDNDSGPFFVNAPELVDAAKTKVSRPLYAAVVRLAAKSPDALRSWNIMRKLSSALGVFGKPGGNELIPLRNDEYLEHDHEEDLLCRQSRRSGMLLNSDELIGFIHLPSPEVRSSKLARQTQKTKSVPKILENVRGIQLGENIHAGERVPVALSPDQRVRHMHIIGASGTGKSTLLFNLIRQDIENGQGLAVLDPHGDLVDHLLGIIPPGRIDDVVLADPTDEEYSVGFNMLSAHSDLEKNLLASDLVSVFQRLSTSWGDQMGSVLQNAILAFLESSRGGTIADVRRFLIEPEFRNEFLTTVRDPDIVYYWRKGFVQLSGNKSIGSVITRLDTFLGPKPIRYMVSQKENRLDFSNILDTGKIFLAKLSQGLLGKENSFLLGTLLVSKFQQLSMARQRQEEILRKDFTLFVDEFHNFITPSMAEILAGARKYRIGLVLAHQELRQLQRDSEVASAVLGNAGTRICFRVGDDDARKLAEGFSSFEARDLQNLETGQAIARVERSDFDFNLNVPLPTPVSKAEARQRRQEVIAASRKKYATSRAEVEAKLYHKVPPEIVEPTVKLPTALVDPSGSELKTSQPRVETERLPRAEPATPPPVIVPTQVPAPQTNPPTSPPSPESKELGRGGRQHKYLQHLIKQLAISMNFEVDVEKQVLGGEGSVDVALRKGDMGFAFEISVTTDVLHEIGNLRKCKKAGFQEVVMVCVEPVSLGKLREAVLKEFPEPERNHIHFCLPENISPLLIEFSAQTASKDTVSHGRKTRVMYRPVSEEEARKRREVLAQVSTQSLKKLNED